MSTWSDFLRLSVLGLRTEADYSSVGRRVRVPFKFTSDMCLAEVGNPTLFGEQIAVSGTQTTATSGIKIQTLSNSVTANKFGIVSMAINPQSIKWTQPKRFIKRDTMNGSTYMHFLNDNQQDNDIARLEFSGTTGNISLKGSSLPNKTPLPNDTRGYEKLLRFHQLYNLTRQPKLYQDGLTGQWLENKHHILYTSQVLPFPVELVGFYDVVLSFEESAQRPNQVSYNFSFIVQTTHPGMDQIAGTIGQALAPTGQSPTI